MSIILNNKQKQQIELGKRAGLDTSLYSDPEYSVAMMKVIREGLLDGVDLSDYARKGYNASQIRVIMECMDAGYNPKRLGSVRTSARKMKETLERIQNDTEDEIAPAPIKESTSKYSKTSIIELVLRYKDDKDLLEFLSLVLNSFGEYVDIINKEENATIVDKYRMSREDYMDELKILDTHRRMCHNTIIHGIKRINLMCKEAGIPNFYNGDEEDRVQISEFVIKVIDETFKNRKK